VVGLEVGSSLTDMLSWKNGRQVDALKLKLPGGEPMKSANKARFKDYRTIEV
jgi:hypothetical protein